MQGSEPAKKRPRMTYTASAAAVTEADESDHRMPDAFLAYYASQELCSAAAWEATLQLLRRPLLLSVRVNKAVAGEDGGVAAAVAPLRKLLHDSLKPIPWLPAAFIVKAEGNFTVPSSISHEAGGAPDAAEASTESGTEGGGAAGGEWTLEQAVQHALITGMKSGELAQQEVTSMVPPLLLAPEPQHV